MLKIKSFEFNPMQENTYIVYNEFNECAIIDPGCYSDKEKNELAGFIAALDLKPVLLLNTHCHLDHVFGNKLLAEKYNLLLQIHANEKQVLEYAPVSGLVYNIPFDNYSGELIYVKEGDLLHIGNDQLKVLHTPGHSPGSVSFYCAKDKFVISGDALFYRSIGRTDLPGGDHQTLLDSIANELLVLPGSTKVYSGHGPITTIEEESRNNPFLK